MQFKSTMALDKDINENIHTYHVLIDMDNTLYNYCDTNYNKFMHEYISKYFLFHLGSSSHTEDGGYTLKEADELARNYYQEYGLNCTGLIKNHFYSTNNSILSDHYKSLTSEVLISSFNMLEGKKIAKSYDNPHDFFNCTIGNKNVSNSFSLIDAYTEIAENSKHGLKDSLPLSSLHINEDLKKRELNVVHYCRYVHDIACQNYNTLKSFVLENGTLKDNVTDVNGYVVNRKERNKSVRRTLLNMLAEDVRVNPQSKKKIDLWLFTNSYRGHSKKILEAMGIEDLFVEKINWSSIKRELKEVPEARKNCFTIWNKDSEPKYPYIQTEYKDINDTEFLQMKCIDYLDQFEGKDYIDPEKVYNKPSEQACKAATEKILRKTNDKDGEKHLFAIVDDSQVNLDIPNKLGWSTVLVNKNVKCNNVSDFVVSDISEIDRIFINYIFNPLKC